MNIFTLFSGTGNATQTAVNIAQLNYSEVNRNNIGVYSVAQASGTVSTTLQGSVDGTNFITIASAVVQNTGNTVMLMPWMRVISGSHSGGAFTCYIVQ
jgi:hypothetical protein